ncbi:hypothetical protein [Flavobacterium sp. N3904]|uniref:hypothetical protein n=1 Tax=Flavobacterium sp. N3904 TaxID=2986835 RepID=UPI002224FFDE|nr:hypothetical protein [Flavobacterium sp. N3904]
MSLKEKFLEAKTILFQKYWVDPVWSKVISAIIIAIGTALYIIVKSIYNKISFLSTTQQVVSYFQSSTKLNNLVIWISLFIICWALIIFTQSILKKLNTNKEKTNSTNDAEELPVIYDHSTTFFAYRLASAFPGQRGLEWYDSKTAVNRLKIVFQDPIDFKPNINSEYVSDPLWWFRGHRSMFIKKFKQLSKTKILLGIDELEINRIAVFVSDSYYKCFIYIETKGEKQIGLYNRTEEEIKNSVGHFGYCWEEYALMGKRPISREHYDDGATIINGKVVETSQTELRVRYLSNYNFLLTAKESPYNSRKFDRESQDYFDKILKDEIAPETFFDYLDTFRKHEE